MSDLRVCFALRSCYINCLDLGTCLPSYSSKESKPDTSSRQAGTPLPLGSQFHTSLFPFLVVPPSSSKMVFIERPPESADFIIIGGGTAGLALASRLSHSLPSTSNHSILVLEAGEDRTGHPLTSTPSGAFAAHDSEIDWNYDSISQKQLKDRVIHMSAGKALSGATAVNYGLWNRGPKADYDRWGELTGDEGWSYEGLLPYFKAMEHHFDDSPESREHHGFSGPVATISVLKSDPTRQYPLRSYLKQGFQEMGLKINPDYNSGDSLGIGELVENWKDGKREAANQILDLSKVHILCGAWIERVIIEDTETGGKELRGSRSWTALS